MDNRLESEADAIQAEFESRHNAREAALNQSRDLIRHCANAIRAMHRDEWSKAEPGLQQVREAARQLIDATHAYPDLYYAGYTQDALKEYVEAFAAAALIRDEALPTQAELDVPGSTYLNGLAEAASEMRRRCLDTIRRGETDEAERLFGQMEDIYGVLMGFDYPDAITGGLRRRVDQLRGVLERTRGDLTNSIRQQQLQDALIALEKRLGLD
ncbi:MAG: haloacid dehalogenase [Chloroflexi bacterium]|nr:haloacid dehalogenase [Chloroflexota bacterium]